MPVTRADELDGLAERADLYDKQAAHYEAHAHVAEHTAKAVRFFRREASRLRAQASIIREAGR